MQKALIRFYLWATLGLSTEIFFTAFSDLFIAIRDHKPIDWGLGGHSYVWMTFIYGSGSLIFPFGHRHLKGFHLLIRIFLIAIGIFVVEFITGFILDKVTGHCPWEYTARWNVMGYIRLDYLPAWMVFGYMIERADELFDKMSHGVIGEK
jgi:uncharacterized membrane protein